MTLADGHEGQKGQKSGIEPVVSTTMPTIVSFAAERDSLIRNGEFTMFIRKQGRRTCPRTIYFYVAQPVSAIVAHAVVTGYGWLTAQQAMEFADELKMTQAEIGAYFNSGVRSTSVCAIRVDRIRQFPNPITYSTLLADFGMKAPQGFRDIDASVEYSICKLGGFSDEELHQLATFQNESAKQNPKMGKNA